MLIFADKSFLNLICKKTVKNYWGIIIGQLVVDNNKVSPFR